MTDRQRKVKNTLQWFGLYDRKGILIKVSINEGNLSFLMDERGDKILPVLVTPIPRKPKGGRISREK